MLASGQQFVSVQPVSVMQVGQVVANVVSRRSPAKDGPQLGSPQKETPIHTPLVRFC